MIDVYIFTRIVQFYKFANIHDGNDENSTRLFTVVINISKLRPYFCKVYMKVTGAKLKQFLWVG